MEEGRGRCGPNFSFQLTKRSKRVACKQVLPSLSCIPRAARRASLKPESSFCRKLQFSAD